MPSPGTTAVEIDSKLRDDFRRRLKDYGYASDVTDPILSVLFRTFAQQLESLYSETDRIRLAVLDELIGNLGIEPRMARPAQTVARFLLENGAAVVPAGTELLGEAQSGERLTFMTDATVAISGARIAAAFGYQDGSVQAIPGIEMTEALHAARPSLDPVRVNLGPNPAIFLAIENLPPGHLGQHSFFVELGPDAYRIAQALDTETWCLVESDGVLAAAGILRPTLVNGGVKALDWLVREAALPPPENDDEGQVPNLPPGFYGSRLFIMPPVPASRRFMCRIPRAMDAPFARIFGRESETLFGEPRAWLRISMPRDIPALRSSIVGMALHAVTASNVECLNQTIVFAQHGTSIPVVRDAGGTASQLVAPLSVLGEQGASYLPEVQPSTDRRVGRYAVRNGRLEFRPALWPDGRAEAYANVRLWITNGSLGNRVGPGRVSGFLKQPTTTGLRVTGPTAAAGGRDIEEFSGARLRFAEALLSRDRVVTQNDLVHVARAFDARIRQADMTTGVARTREGLKHAVQVRVHVDRADFVDPATELAILTWDLERHLVARFPAGTNLTVAVVP
jgi:hypothetical protein